jgi:hypothetical protein
MNRLTHLQRTFISTTLVLSGLIFLVFSLRNSTDQLMTTIMLIKPGYLLLSLIITVITLIIFAYAYFLILSRTVPVGLSPLNVIIPWIFSQVVRYLPGKIWGIFYQVQATAKWIPARYTIKANIEQYALSQLNLIAVASGAYIYFYRGIISALAVFTSVLLIEFLVMRKHVVHRIMHIVPSLLSINKESFRVPESNKKEVLILCLFQAEWVLHILVCAMILPKHFGAEEVIIVAISYTAAASIGALAFVIPSGLIIREASFIWLGGLLGFEPADMFVFSIALRLIIMSSEIICVMLGVILLGFKPLRGKHADT